MVLVEEDAALEPPIQYKSKCPTCCGCRCTYRVPTLRELYDQDKRLLRAILLIVIFLNTPIGRYILYPFLLFSTWIHELFHGLAALSIGGSIIWLNIYSDGSGLAYTSFPTGAFQRAWVASAGYQSTAIVGGIMLMFRRTDMGARVGTCGVGLIMLLTCALFVRNTFGLIVLVLTGILLVIAGWRLPPFWVSELVSQKLIIPHRSFYFFILTYFLIIFFFLRYLNTYYLVCSNGSDYMSECNYINTSFILCYRIEYWRSDSVIRCHDDAGCDKNTL